jgi:hypothetical protein
MPGNWLRSAGWMTVIVVCFALFGALVFKVNTVISQVRQAERQIVALRQEKMMLETEFETRSNQQQLAEWNDVEFGYQAPGPGQFMENDRQLAALGTPRAPGAPTPIRVMTAEAETEEQGFPQMVSPLTGKAFAAEEPSEGKRPRLSPKDLSERLSGGSAQISLAGLGAAE